MKPEDEVCFCYHIPLRKLTAFARRERPQRASQMSNCLGAGTGCGWCIPILRRIQAQVAENVVESPAIDVSGLPDSAENYAAGRRDYLRSDQKNSF